MVIEILFSEIVDKAKIYHETIKETESRFGSEKEKSIDSQYVGKEYCTQRMEMVKSKIPNMKTCEYKGALERIGKEFFELKTEKNTYTVSCTIDTYQSKKNRMLVRISSEIQEGQNVSVSTDFYDQALEKLKLEIKNVFRSDWKSCVWIKDEQSEFLCSKLYPCIFRAENRLRAFANKLLIWNLGSEWLNSPGLEKYAESHKKLSEDFRTREPAFTDVDDVFISTTLETLFEIIQKGVVYESPFQLSQNQFNDFISLISKSDKENLAKWVLKRRCEKKNLWKDIFEPYFSATNNSQQIITDFIKNRNHIAHNKPITFSAYEIMDKSFADLDDMVKTANRKFEESAPSEELYLTIDLENEQIREAEEQIEYEQNYLRDRIEGETGVEILWRDDIFELLSQKAELIYQTFYDLFYWDSKFTLTSMSELDDDESWQTLFSIQCNANKDCYLEIQVQIIIDDEMDGDSFLYIRYITHDLDGESIHSNEGLPSATIRYHNGSGSENIFEGTIDVDSDSFIDESEIDNLLEELESAIEGLNPYIDIKEYMERDAIKYGENNPVADFPCVECEEYGVSLRDDFYKFGHCCYCGTDNEVKVCKICSTPYGDGDGHNEMCNACISLIEKD